MSVQQDTIQAMLGYIDPHDREQWYEIGTGIKTEYGDSGFDTWNTWSQEASNYNERDARDSRFAYFKTHLPRLCSQPLIDRCRKPKQV